MTVKILVDVDDLEALIDNYDADGGIAAADPDLAWLRELKAQIARARATR